MEEYDEPAFDSDTLIDPELDTRSERFNPIKALFSPDIHLAANVRIFDNVAQFESNLNRQKQSEQQTSVNSPSHNILLFSEITYINDSIMRLKFISRFG